MSAQNKYKELHGTVESQLSHLKSLLKEHNSNATPDYADCGDLGHTICELAELISFLGGDPQAAKPNKFWVDNKVVVIPE